MSHQFYRNSSSSKVLICSYANLEEIIPGPGIMKVRKFGYRSLLAFPASSNTYISTKNSCCKRMYMAHGYYVLSWVLIHPPKCCALARYRCTVSLIFLLQDLFF